ncbi:RNA polymerase I enhancer binding protein [Tilletia horrida]|nr:RNA polymerase I enhancer binding protein [Tilletia horrida]
MAGRGSQASSQADPSSQLAADSPTSSHGPSRKRARSNSEGPSARVQKDIERAIAKYAGWPARDIVIHNEGYGAILQALKKEYNLEYREGQFSEAEVEVIMKQVDLFKKRNKMTEGQLHRILFGPATKDNKAVMKELVLDTTTALNGTRPYPAVREFLQRRLRDGARQGRWSNDEVKQLMQSVANHGNQWNKISQEVGRTGEDCRKKIDDMEKTERRRGLQPESGSWSNEDVELLKTAVEKVKQDQGLSDAELFDGRTRPVPIWKTVLEESGIQKRTEAQLRQKYHRLLDKQTGKRQKRAPKRKQERSWNVGDRAILLDRIIAQLRGPYAQESDIKWAELCDEEWNWAPHILMRRWTYIKNKYGTERWSGSFIGRCEAMRKRAVANKNRWLKRSEKKKQEEDGVTRTAKKNAASVSDAAAADGSGADTDTADASTSNAQNKGKAVSNLQSTRAKEKQTVLGKRTRDESDEEEETDMSSEDEEEATQTLRKKMMAASKKTSSQGPPSRKATGPASQTQAGPDLDDGPEPVSGVAAATAGLESDTSSEDALETPPGSRIAADGAGNGKGSNGEAPKATAAGKKVPQTSSRIASESSPEEEHEKNAGGSASSSEVSSESDSDDDSSSDDDGNVPGVDVEDDLSSSSEEEEDDDDEDDSSSEEEDDDDDDDEEEEEDEEDEDADIDVKDAVPNDNIDSDEEASL